MHKSFEMFVIIHYKPFNLLLHYTMVKTKRILKSQCSNRDFLPYYDRSRSLQSIAIAINRSGFKQKNDWSIVSPEDPVMRFWLKIAMWKKCKSQNACMYESFTIILITCIYRFSFHANLKMMKTIKYKKNINI